MLLRNEDQFLIVDGLDIEMANFKCLFSAVEAAEKIMAEWSDEVEEDNIDIVLLPPENIDAVTDDEEVDENGERVDNRMLNDVGGTIEIQTNILEIEEKEQIDNNGCIDSVEETNRYAAQKNSKALFTAADLETFNAMLRVTGYHSLPRTRMFWEKDDDWTVHCIRIYFSERVRRVEKIHPFC